MGIQFGKVHGFMSITHKENTKGWQSRSQAGACLGQPVSPGWVSPCWALRTPRGLPIPSVGHRQKKTYGMSQRPSTFLYSPSPSFLTTTSGTTSHSCPSLPYPSFRICFIDNTPHCGYYRSNDEMLFLLLEPHTGIFCRLS